MRIKCAIAGLAALVLGACQQGVSVSIDQSGIAPTFDVTRSSSEKAACVDDVSLYAGEPEGDPVWHIAASDGAPCTSHFRFGDTPSGFGTDEGPHPALRAGTRYTVVVSGKGFLGGETFVAEKSSR